MTPPTANSVECWLFDQGGWVSSDHICTRWQICERRLRLLGVGFLISRPGGGYIHRYHATPDELEAYCGPKWAHGVGELKNVKLLRKLYRERRRPYPVDQFNDPILL